MLPDDAIVKAAEVVDGLDRVTVFKFTRSSDVAERRRCAQAVARWLDDNGYGGEQFAAILRRYGNPARR